MIQEDKFNKPIRKKYENSLEQRLRTTCVVIDKENHLVVNKLKNNAP